jgi:hypothetical protein
MSAPAPIDLNATLGAELDRRAHTAIDAEILAHYLPALEAAESFMSGFENDDMQEPPVTDRLALIRAAIATARGEA